MDFNDNASQAEWRKEVATFLAAEKPKSDPDATPQEMMERGRSMMKEWRGKLSAKGWVAPAWPKEYGGGGLSKKQARILQEEMAKAGAYNPIGGMGVMMFGPTLLEYGNEEQKRKYLPEVASVRIRPRIWSAIIVSISAFTSLRVIINSSPPYRATESVTRMHSLRIPATF